MFLQARLLLLFFTFGFTFVQAQEVLSGRVIDANDSTPVSYAAIYLPDLSMGTTADSLGNFRMSNVPGAAQRVVVSCVGYKTTTASLSLYLDNVVTLQKGETSLDPVIIIGTQTQLKEQSVTTVTTLDQHAMRSHGALSISDGVSHMPGVTQLNTGVGISKPVIRGLYGNRIQSIVMGMRFDNQQWQDEHGLGLQDIGVDRVEVIKGPMSLVYGSEAMGGVLNILEESPGKINTVRGDASIRAFSNTWGIAVDAGVKVTKENYFWRVRAGSESHADYSDGNNKRVVNSRFDGHVAKATFGFNRRNWSCINNYLFSKSDFGFIMDTSGYLVPDGRLARGFANPHHTVFINMFTTQNTFFTGRSIIRLIVGGHINRRMEDEGGGGISLDMQLITASLHLQFEKPIGHSWNWLNGIQSQYQHNVNFGWRKIVPDATMAEASVYSFIKYIGQQKKNAHPFVFESGLRFDLRTIETYETGTLNTGQFALPPVSRLYTAINGSAGVAIPFLKFFTWRMNATSGYRSPNLAELSSSGVHEGTLRFEVGNVNMKTEQNFCGEVGLLIDWKQLSVSAAAFYNYFRNYIYLVPTNEDWFGFRVYRFIQTDAVLKGLEGSIDFHPQKMKWLNVIVNYSSIRAVTGDDNYLPFIPADRIDGSVHTELGERGKWKGIYVRGGVQYYFPQDRPAQFETSTPDYGLFDAGAGVNIQFTTDKSLQVDIACNNLLNKVYYDHLSRFKEFGIYNIGRNITLNLKYQW